MLNVSCAFSNGLLTDMVVAATAALDNVSIEVRPGLLVVASDGAGKASLPPKVGISNAGDVGMPSTCVAGAAAGGARNGDRDRDRDRDRDGDGGD